VPTSLGRALEKDPFSRGLLRRVRGTGAERRYKRGVVRLPAHGLLFITTNVTIIISVDLHLGKAKVIYLLVLLSRHARCFILLYIFII
jgi:hypothetical protein